MVTGREWGRNEKGGGGLGGGEVVCVGEWRGMSPGAWEGQEEGGRGRWQRGGAEQRRGKLSLGTWRGRGGDERNDDHLRILELTQGVSARARVLTFNVVRDKNVKSRANSRGI